MDDHEDDLDATREDFAIEGMWPRLTHQQRTQRIAIASVAVFVVLAILLWPTLSALSSLPTVYLPRVQPTVTADDSSWLGGSGISSRIDLGSSNVMCPVTPLQPNDSLSEMHPDIIGAGDIWALLLSGTPVRAGHEANIVWRATGAGAFSVLASDGNGAQLAPTSGPNPHLSSSWHRPGDEWGTVFTFPQAGCWQVQVSRGAGLRAYLWLQVDS
jgi:hypothetical protein